MGILRPYYQNLPRLHLEISCNLLIIKGAVFILIVRFSLVTAIRQRFPPYGLFTFKQHMNVNVLTMNLKHLLLGLHTLRIAVVDKECIALYFDSSQRSIKQIVALHIIKSFLEQRMQHFKSATILQSR